MKRKKIATIATVVLAIPVGLLVLGYVVIVSMPTGMDEARARVGHDLELVAAKTAKVVKAPSAAKADRAEAGPLDYETVCDLALAALPRGMTRPPSLSAAMGPRAGYSLKSIERLGDLPLAATPQEWVAALNPVDELRPAISDRGDFGMPLDPAIAANVWKWEAASGAFEKLHPADMQQWLDAMESLVYGREWSVPPYQQNWPAACSESPLAVATAAQMVLLRAAARGDAERVARYLPRCVEISLETRLALHSRSRPNPPYGLGSNRLDNGQSLSRTLVLTSCMVGLPDPVWADVAERIAKSRLTDDEANALRSAFVIRQGEGLKRQIGKLERSENSIHFFWQGRLQVAVMTAMTPVLKQRIDAYSAALLTPSGDTREASDRLSLAARAAQIDARLDSYFQPSYEGVPFEGNPNYACDWDEAVVAAIRYRLHHGALPQSFDELMPDLGTPDFQERSQGAWLIFHQEDATVVARIAPYNAAPNFWRTAARRQPWFPEEYRDPVAANMMVFPAPSEITALVLYLAGS